MSAKLKVIHSCTSLSFSGLERYVLDLAGWQRENGHDVELFCRDGSELEKAAQSRGIPRWTIGACERKGPLLWARMRGGWSRRLETAAGSGVSLVLHMHAGGEPWFHLPWLLWPRFFGPRFLRPRLLGRPRALAKTILQYHLWIDHPKHDPVHRLVFSGVDEIWSSSESSRAHLSAILPVDREKMRVVPYGRDVRALLAPAGNTAAEKNPPASPRDRARSELGLAPDDLVGICVSRIEPIKGIGELFDAFAGIAPLHPRATMLLVGGVSPGNAGAEAFARGLRARHARLPEGVRARFRFLGYRARCEELMTAADFYVLPSYEECMSLAMLDALILGLPVLGTNSGGTPSVARPGETGWLVPPRDSAALARAMGEVFTALERDPRALAPLASAARALGSTFERETIFRRVWEMYGE